MNPALYYLALRSNVGMIKLKLGQLKNPKYLIPAVLGIAYVLFAMLPGMMSSGERSGSAAGIFSTIGSVYLMVSLGFIWVSGNARGALSFSEAEAEILLSSPITRTEIIHFHVLKGQMLVALASVMLGIFLPIVTMAPSNLMMMALAFFLINFIRIYNLMISFLWQAMKNHPLHWPFRISGGIFLAICGVMSIGGIKNKAFPYAAIDIWGIHIPAEIVFWLTHLPRTIIDAAFAQAPTNAWSGWGVCIAGMGVAYLVARNLSFSFEEHLLDQAEKRSKLGKAALSGRFKDGKEHKKSMFALSPTGVVWRAYFWKGAMQLVRGSNFRSLVFLLIGNIAIWLFTILMGWREANMVIGAMILPFALLSSYLLPAVLRTDFRGEMDQMEVVKTLPISPRQIFATLVGLTALVTILVQMILGVLAYLSFLLNDNMVENAWILGPCAITAIPALTLTLIIIENGLILWLPAWFAIKPPDRGKGGIEFLGRGIMSILSRTLLLSLMMLIPGLLGLLVAFLSYNWIGIWAWALGTAVGASLLIIEAVLIGGNIAVLYARLEPGSEELT